MAGSAEPAGKPVRFYTGGRAKSEASVPGAERSSRPASLAAPDPRTRSLICHLPTRDPGALASRAGDRRGVRREVPCAPSLSWPPRSPRPEPHSGSSAEHSPPCLPPGHSNPWTTKCSGECRYTEDEARKIGVVGWVKNTSKGTVTGQVQGPEEKVNSMMSWLSKVGSPSSRIDRTNFSNEKTISKLDYSNFSIRY
ncbi:acylphosphatase-2 isoform X2 [Suricata suricatta]|uniref:acylphosphatase n=1 Tax=Suricata suricatta TaxID=37032 RepID=A0A673T1G8_SURSU|nr:acylphosphatase-2 isoform X2 [Suricata suricatta]